jgi:hypothetical protein
MDSARRWFTAVVLALGAATFLYLLYAIGPVLVWGQLRQFGWGFALVLPFQLFDHLINALGWLFAFPRAATARVPFWRLVKVRIAGDGVNYLTPSGNIAGEFVRPAMMGDCAPADTLTTSVIVAKAAQAWGQALFVLLGLMWLLHGRLYAFEGRQVYWATLSMVVILGGVALVVAALIADPPGWVKQRFPSAIESTAGLRLRLREYVLLHPGRLIVSTGCFMLGYTWGAAEIWLISYLMGLTLTLEQALAIEFLSNLVDAMMFMVPAKIGTQEAGKTAIFTGLGLPPAAGFTVGLIRHARELLWAGAGFAVFAAHQRELKR